MLLAKRQGGTTVRGHTWEHDGAVADVPYDLAMELLAIKGGGFYVPETPPEEAGIEESSKPKAKAKQDAQAAAPAVPAPAAAKPAAAK